MSKRNDPELFKFSAVPSGWEVRPRNVEDNPFSWNLFPKGHYHKDNVVEQDYEKGIPRMAISHQLTRFRQSEYLLARLLFTGEHQLSKFDLMSLPVFQYDYASVYEDSELEGRLKKQAKSRLKIGKSNVYQIANNHIELFARSAIYSGASLGTNANDTCEHQFVSGSIEKFCGRYAAKILVHEFSKTNKFSEDAAVDRLHLTYHILSLNFHEYEPPRYPELTYWVPPSAEDFRQPLYVAANSTISLSAPVKKWAEASGAFQSLLNSLYWTDLHLRATS